jgi:peptidoglycan L-alanyl-D-glutamate endopeptidase CwlK
MKLSARDQTRLMGVHHDLVNVTERAFYLFDEAFADAPSMRVFVIEGLRTRERQAEYVKTGASRTMNSRHLTGHAVDLGIQADGGMRWEFPLYQRLWLKCMQPSSVSLGIPVEWGGVAFGPRFLDGPHFQLDTVTYT